MTDTHAHFRTAADYVLDSLDRVIAVGGTPELDAAARAAAARHPGKVFFTLGLDRDQAVAGDCTDALAALRAALAAETPCAIGEVGLDFHHHAPDTAPAQSDLLRAQLLLAAEFDLPAVIHLREADDYILPVLDTAPCRGVIHSYTGNRAMAKQLLDRGLYISFSGIVTFRNADMLRETAAYVPEDRLLIETDSPYLAPVPMRGKSNEPAYVKYIAECLAKLRGVTMEHIESVTDRNAETLFRLSRLI